MLGEHNGSMSTIQKPRSTVIHAFSTRSELYGTAVGNGLYSSHRP